MILVVVYYSSDYVKIVWWLKWLVRKLYVIVLMKSLENSVVMKFVMFVVLNRLCVVVDRMLFFMRFGVM